MPGMGCEPPCSTCITAKPPACPPPPSCRYACEFCVKGAVPADCTAASLCPAAADGTATCPLDPLKPSKTYAVACRAIRADGSKSALSNEAEITTAELP